MFPLKRAKGLLINLVGSSNITMDRVVEVQVTVMATGIDTKRYRKILHFFICHRRQIDHRPGRLSEYPLSGPDG